MTEQEYSAWLSATQASASQWQRDRILEHNSGYIVFAYIGGTAGRWISISKAGVVALGTYEDALPHIGDACFKQEWTHDFKDGNEAVAVMCNRGGVSFLRNVLFAPVV